MNNLLKSAARKHALSNGIATASWTDQQFAEYVEQHGITERDNLKKGNHSTNGHTGIKEAMEEAGTTLGRGKDGTIKPVAKPTGKVDAAIAELIAATSQQSDLDEERVIELIKAHSTAPTTTRVEIKQQDKQEITRELCHKDYALVLAHIAAGVNVAAVGPAGSGKSTLFKNAAEDLGLDYYTTGAVQQESKIMGYMDANGKYIRTPFRDAYEKGGLIVLEEADGSSARALLAANNATANDVTDFPDGMVNRHEDFVCVMAMNTFGTGASRQYVGRTQLDGATLDRFAFIEIGYDEALERQIALSFNDAAGFWVEEVQAFRKRIEGAGIRHVVSPRASIMGAKLLKQGLPHEVIIKTTLHKGLTADQIKQVSR